MKHLAFAAAALLLVSALPTEALAASAPATTSTPSSAPQQRPRAKKQRAAKKPAPAPKQSQDDAAPASPPRASPQELAAAPPPPQDAPRAAQAEAGQDPSLDFELLEPAAPAPVENLALERAISRRRTMLSLHQGLGLGMAGGLVATTVVGQLNFNDRYRGGGADGSWKTLHRGLAVGTSALFATVAVMGVLAPEPYPKPLRFDTVLMHKIFMSLAAAGMVTQVVLGLITASSAQEGQLSQVRFATAHQVAGYSTLGFTTAGVLTLFVR